MGLAVQPGKLASNSNGNSPVAVGFLIHPPFVLVRLLMTSVLSRSGSFRQKCDFFAGRGSPGGDRRGGMSARPSQETGSQRPAIGYDKVRLSYPVPSWRGPAPNLQSLGLEDDLSLVQPLSRKLPEGSPQSWEYHQREKVSSAPMERILWHADPKPRDPSSQNAHRGENDSVFGALTPTYGGEPIDGDLLKSQRNGAGVRARFDIDGHYAIVDLLDPAPSPFRSVRGVRKRNDPMAPYGCDPSRQVVNRKRGTSPADVSLSLSRGTYRTIPLQRETGEIRQDSTLETSLDAASAPR